MSNTNIPALTRRTSEKGELGRHTNIPALTRRTSEIASKSKIVKGEVATDPNIPPALTRRTSEKSEIATEPSKSKIVIEKGEVATDPNIPALTPRKSKTVRFERGELAKDTFENGELADYFSNRTPKPSRTPKLSRKSKRNRTAKLSRTPNPEPTFLSFPEQNSIFSTTHCLRYYNESAKFKCNRFLKRKNITGFETDEIGNVTDINSQCGLLHHRISEINATKNSFVHRPREIVDFIDKSQGKSDNINNDNKYGIIFKDGKIKNMNDIYIYRNRGSPPTTLRMLLLDQKINRSKISFGVNDLFVGVGKKQTRRKSNKKTNKRRAKKINTRRKK
jgi:hypothetical protein